MKTQLSLAQLHKLIILAFLLSFCGHAAEPTFETVGHVMTIGSTTGRSIHRMELVRECVRAGETLPAQSDLAGNWGTVSDDRQLSIWLPKGEYLIGEPVIASVLLRNVGDRTLLDAPRNPEPLLIAVQTNQFLPRKDGLPPDSPIPYNIEDIGPRVGWTLKPGWQRKYKVLVSEIYNLSTPGGYHITAKRFFLRTNETWGEVVSGTATFRVTAGAPAAAPTPSGTIAAAPSVESRGTASSSDANVRRTPPSQSATNALALTNEERAASVQADTVTVPTDNAAPEGDRPAEQLASGVTTVESKRTSRFVLLASLAIIGLLAFFFLRRAKSRG